MPRVQQMRPLIEFYNPRARRQFCPLFNYRYLHGAARNLAAAFRDLHARGYVIGDVRETNTLASEIALVTLVDTDSFQVPNPQGGFYPCPVFTPECLPPELQDGIRPELERNPEQDLFGLAVLIFRLLMEGFHPFDGVFTKPGEPH